jgi:ABC-type polysaccharide/polyol phosphate export permease
MNEVTKSGWLFRLNPRTWRVNWLAVHAYASQRMRARYAGSVLGDFWLVAPTAVFLIAVALVWSQLWGISLKDYFAYFAAGFIFYTFIAGTLNESSGVIVTDSRLYLNARLSPMFSIFAHIYRSGLGLAHNMVLLVPVLLLYVDLSLRGVGISLLGLGLSLLFMIPSCFLLGMFSVRYRDLLHLIHSIFQIMFLVTPVMWRLERLPAGHRGWIFANPIASFLNLTRDALLGLPVHRAAWVSALVWMLVVWGLYFLFARKLERSFTVWL